MDVSFILFYHENFSRRSFFPHSRKVMDGVHPAAVYEELISVRLVGMMLVIVVRQELRKNIIRYSTETVGTGALNFMVRLSHFYRIDSV